MYLQGHVHAVSQYTEQMLGTTGDMSPTDIIFNIHPQLVAIVRSGEIVQLFLSRPPNAQLISQEHQRSHDLIRD